MKPKAARIVRAMAMAALLLPASSLAQQVLPGTQAPYATNPYTGMSGSTGIPFVTNPYGGMFGSMGNVYSPYYRQFHQFGMGGMSGPLAGSHSISVMHYVINPYAGMYGSMGNVYSPYYRQFHQSGMGGMTGVLIPGTELGQGVQYHYPYFLPPTMGAR